MDRKQIKELALECGFKLKSQADGSEDLNEYVYKFAEELIKDRDQLIKELTNDYNKCAAQFGMPLAT